MLCFTKFSLVPFTLFYKVTIMSTQQAALENLRVIRSLMEKAHIYRAISAPAALVGGVLSFVGFFCCTTLMKGIAMLPAEFLKVWITILVITGSLNLLLLARDAKRRGQKFVSDGMKAALKTLAPPLLAGGVVGIGLVVWLHAYTMAALIWIVCYGLALLATASFSPSSLIRLGWLFLISGLILFCLWAANGDVRLIPEDEGIAGFAMASTFGLLHIGYGLAVLFSKKPEPLPAE